MSNTEYTVARIFSEFNYGRWTIHKYGYTPDGQQVKVKADFTDYFYFKSAEVSNLIPFDRLDQNDHGDYVSIYGDFARKIEYRSIKEKNQVVKQYPESTYEADVSPEFHYMMEMPVTWTPANKRHILYFDIETDAREKSSSPEKPDAEVTSIQLYSTRFKKYFVFSWHPEKTQNFISPKIIQTDDRTYIFCKDEYDVLDAFIAFIEEYSPDVLCGYYSAGFDLPYIINRCQRLNIDYNRLSPIGKVRHYQKMGTWKTYISGLDHIDMLEAIQDIGYNLPNYKLATVADEILKDFDTQKLTKYTWKDWLTNYKGFIEYGIVDVQILKEVDEVLGIFDLYYTIQKMTNITSLGEVMFKSSVVDKYIMTESRGVHVFPTRKTAKRQKYMGAHVMDPVAGLHEGVAVFDYASLYPTSIMSFNLSPETFICSEKEVENKGMTIQNVIDNLNERGINFVDTGYDKELFGERYLFYAQDHKLGIFPKMLKKMYDERRTIKAQMRDEKDEVKHNALDKHQTAIKLILNSAYGALGFNYFRLYRPEVADAITYFARQALFFGEESLKELGHDTIYGDTDSLFTLQNGKSNDVFDTWVEEFNNEALPNVFITKYNSGPLDEYKTMEIEYEKDMERIYFSKSKKRYYGIVRDTGYKYIRGLNIIRKDAPSFLKDKLNVMSEKAVNGELKFSHLQSLRKLVELQPLKSIGITKKFSRPFHKYEKTQPQHLKAALWANEILETKVTHKDNPYLFYVTSTCQDEMKPKERNNAICVLEADLPKLSANPDLFVIDYDEYFHKQVIQQLEEFKLIPTVKEALDEYKESIK